MHKILGAILTGNYFALTDEAIAANGGQPPTCPTCHEVMYPLDDHGRFGCSCHPFGRDEDYLFAGLFPRSIPQVSTDGMSDAEKAKIPPINRLESPVTKAEAAYFALMAKGPDVMGTPDYQAAVAAIEAERNQ
ncbi:MAG: hypothetical protein WC516_03830 [Patescibacteria group bacterium]